MIRPMLVVEDDGKIARVVAIYLEQAGYRVSAASGKNALDASCGEAALCYACTSMEARVARRRACWRGAIRGAVYAAQKLWREAARGSILGGSVA